MGLRVKSAAATKIVPSLPATPTSQSLNVHIQPFIPMLQPPRRKEIKRIVQVKVVVAVPMRADEFVDFLLVPRVEVLEFVHGLEFLDVETVGDDAVYAERSEARERKRS